MPLLLTDIVLVFCMQHVWFQRILRLLVVGLVAYEPLSISSAIKYCFDIMQYLSQFDKQTIMFTVGGGKREGEFNEAF